MPIRMCIREANEAMMCALSCLLVVMYGSTIGVIGTTANMP